MTDPNKNATLYRMVMAEHICPFGLKSKHLLEQRGYDVEDRWLTTPEQVDAFKSEHGVGTTPQSFVTGQRIGSHRDLRAFFGLHDEASGGASYAPVVCVFLTAVVIAVGASWAVYGTSLTVMAAEWFVAITMMLLAMFKLQNIETFSTAFLRYDLLAQRHIPYAYAHPFLQWFAGAFMTAHVLEWLALPVTLAMGLVGLASVFDAVVVHRRRLRWACVAGAGTVPLGLMAVIENLLMVTMALWLLVR